MRRSSCGNTTVNRLRLWILSSGIHRVTSEFGAAFRTIMLFKPHTILCTLELTSGRATAFLRHISQRTRHMLATQLGQLSGPRHNGPRAERPLKRVGPLTKRQAELLALWDQGLTKKQIMERLGLKRLGAMLEDALYKSGR